MAESKTSQRLKLGAFVAIGLGILIGIVYILGGQQNLFNSTFKLKAKFTNVSGLAEGASVRFQGIDVGMVDNISIINTQQVEITMNIKSEVKKYLHKDARAIIGSEGIMGNTLLNLDPGSVSQPEVLKDQYIVGVQPASFDELLATVQEAGKNAAGLLEDISAISGQIRTGEGTIGKLLMDAQLYNNLSDAMDGFGQTAGGINRVLDQASGSIAYVGNNIRQGRGALGKVVSDTSFANRLDETMINLSKTSSNMERATMSLDQELEALKSSFIFRKYFEKEGYFDSIENVRRSQPLRDARSIAPKDSTRNIFGPKRKKR